MKIKMKNKILIAFLSIGLFATAPLLAQEKGKSKRPHHRSTQQWRRVSIRCRYHIWTFPAWRTSRTGKELQGRHQDARRHGQVCIL